MKSATKRPLAPGDIARLARKCFGEEPAPGMVKSLDGGYFNAVYEIALPGREAPVILKVSPPEDVPVLRYEKHMLRGEAAFLETASARGLPVPRVLALDTERDIVARDALFMTKMEGVTWRSVEKELGPEGNRRIRAELGSLCADFSRVTGERFGYMMAGTEASAKGWTEAFGLMLDNVLMDAADLGTTLPYRPSRLRAIVKAASEALGEVDLPRLVHLDLWPGNVFLERKGDDYTVCGVVDGERAIWGDPLAEFMFRDLEPGNPFIEGFARGFVATPRARTRRLLYSVYLHTAMLVEDDSRHYGLGYLSTKFWLAKSIRKNLAILEQILD